MDSTLTAIEVCGTVNEHNQLELDTLIPINGPKRVRVIVLYSTQDEYEEKDWVHSASQNPAFDYLNDPEEDIYSIGDGKPLDD